MSLRDLAGPGVYFLGEEHERTLVFLHGWMGCGQDWIDLAEPLSKHYCCVALDLPGHGELGNRSIGTESLDEVVEWLSERLIQLDRGDDVVLVGYSMGGRLAVEWAAHQLDRVAGLILLSARPGMPDEDRPSRIRKDEEWARLIRHNWSAFLDKWYAQPLFASDLRTKEELESLIFTRRGNHPGHMADTLVNWSPAHQRDRWESLIDFNRPLLYLAGRRDRKYAGLAGTLDVPVRGRRVEILEDSGHAVHLDQPEQCVHIMQEFLERSREILWP